MSSSEPTRTNRIPNSNVHNKNQPSSSVRTINVLVCGDDAVGKTSIIDAKSSGTFSKDVEDLKGSVDNSGAWGEVVVPGEDVNGKQVNLVIIDTSSRTPTKRMEVLNKMKDADVVVLVYAVDNEESFNRLEDHWVLPIQRVCQQHYENNNRFFPTVPIVLAANKIDKLAGDRNIGFAMYRARVVPLVEKYSNIEAHVPCSAVAMLDLNKVFYHAQKAVLYPFKPLTNIPTVGELFVDNSNNSNRNSNLELKEKIYFLSEDYRNALKRIFRLLDVDRDGLLNNDEMNLMQVQCFAAGMSHADLAHVKKTIKDEAKFTAQKEDHIYITHSNVIRDDKWTLEGFYELNKAFLRRNRPESPWSILRHFGYGRDGNTGLRMLLNDYDAADGADRLDNIIGHWGMTSNHANLPQLHRKPDQNCELSTSAYMFLENIFKQFKVNINGTECLREQEVEEIFIIAPENPWRAYRKYNFPWGVPMQYVLKTNGVNSNGEMNTNSSSDVGEGVSKQYEYILNLDSWFAMWSMMTALDYDMTMRYMWYLGFPGTNIESGSIAKEIHLKWPRSVNHLGKAISLKKRRRAVKTAKSLGDRQVIRCFVFGRKHKERQIMLKHLTNAKSDRNSTLLNPGETDGVIHDDMDDLDDDEDDENDDFARSASTSLSESVRTLRDVSAIKWFSRNEYEGYGKGLMMTDIGAEVPRKMNNNSSSVHINGTSSSNSSSNNIDDPMDPCDVACIVYTATDHNAPSYLANLQKTIPDHIPCVYVGLQENERYNENVFDLISKLCDAYELNHPHPIPIELRGRARGGERKIKESEDNGDDALDVFFNDILKSGLYPETHGKRPISRQKREEIERRSFYFKGGIAVVTSVLIIGLSYFAYSSRYFVKQSSNQDSSEKNIAE